MNDHDDHPHLQGDPTPDGLRPGPHSGVQDRSLVWRLSVPVACGLAGLLAATSMINARGTDLRGGRHTDVIGLVSEQRTAVQDLRAQVRTEQATVDALARQVGGASTQQLQRELARLEVPAGLAAISGPGLVVSLDDAPGGQSVPEGTDPNLLVVHQQDIQAVVNALWAGGAEGIALQGQRIIATTGIKCVGNTVVLQGVPYSPPYRIVAVGDSTRMYAALVASPQVRAYRDYTPAPYNLGWSLHSAVRAAVPGYRGALAMAFAEPSRPTGSD